jgi:hypothetical protein
LGGRHVVPQVHECPVHRSHVTSIESDGSSSMCCGGRVRPRSGVIGKGGCWHASV